MRALNPIPLGDRAFFVRFATEAEARAWSRAVRLAEIVGVVDLVAAFRSVAVFADPDQIELEDLAERLRSLPAVELADEAGRLIELPVLYDGEDLSDVARRLNLSTNEVVSLHGSTDYHVFAVGFLPGFPYAGYLPEELSGVPRLDRPRDRVAGGSVAIAGRQTGIYPRESPGGWRLIGRTPLSIVDVDQGRFPIRAGDRIRFQAIDSAEYRAKLGDPLF